MYRYVYRNSLKMLLNFFQVTHYAMWQFLTIIEILYKAGVHMFVFVYLYMRSVYLCVCLYLCVFRYQSGEIKWIYNIISPF